MKSIVRSFSLLSISAVGGNTRVIPPPGSTQLPADETTAAQSY
jgi:hypothetical protein